SWGKGGGGINSGGMKDWDGSFPGLEKRASLRGCSRKSVKNCGLNNTYLFQSRSGSIESRNSHSKPRSCIHGGACGILPARNGNAAPTARSGQERNSRNSYTQISCFGQPKPTKTIEAPELRISFTTWSFSGRVRQRNLEGIVPAT